MQNVWGLLWICGVCGDRVGVEAWELVGVFSDRALALQACRDEGHFIFPVVANLECRCGQEVPTGVEFPRRKKPGNDELEKPRIPR
jgi:hypothetical protein